MSTDTGMEQVIKFRKALKEIFNSPNGETVIKFLQEAYVESPALSSSTEQTFYRLGQKEFVQALIKDATTDIENVNIGG